MLILVIWENEIFISVTSDPQFFPFVNRAIDNPPPLHPTPALYKTDNPRRRGQEGVRAKAKFGALTRRVLTFLPTYSLHNCLASL